MGGKGGISLCSLSCCKREGKHSVVSMLSHGGVVLFNLSHSCLIQGKARGSWGEGRSRIWLDWIFFVVGSDGWMFVRLGEQSGQAGRLELGKTKCCFYAFVLRCVVCRG